MKKAIDEFSPYAPIRMRSQGTWQLARQFGQLGKITSDGRISSDFYEMLNAHVIEPAFEQVSVEARNDPNIQLALGTTLAKITSYNDWVPLEAQYELCGRQIFDFHDRLTELLMQTDLGECTLEGLHAPYDAFYIRFGKLDSVKLPFEDKWEYVDGAFVAWAPWDESGNKRLKIGFSTIHEDGSGVLYPGCFFDLLPNELLMSVPLAIDTALNRRLEKYQDTTNDTENTKALNAHFRAEIEDSASVLRAAASLIINSLFYLESIRTEIPQVAPGRDTPPDLQAKWLQSTAPKRLKQRSSLTADGYALVRLVGQEVHGSQIAGPGSSTKKVHWRRGHWRFQAYGVQFSLRKRIWIKPTLIGGDHGSHEIPGHLYVVAPSNKVQ